MAKPERDSALKSTDISSLNVRKFNDMFDQGIQ